MTKPCKPSQPQHRHHAAGTPKPDADADGYLYRPVAAGKRYGLNAVNLSKKLEQAKKDLQAAAHAVRSVLRALGRNCAADLRKIIDRLR